MIPFGVPGSGHERGALPEHRISLEQHDARRVNPIDAIGTVPVLLRRQEPERALPLLPHHEQLGVGEIPRLLPGSEPVPDVLGVQVILNGNTLERGLDQYISMVQEKEVAGPSIRNVDFPNMACSPELAAYWAFPGITPTMSFGDRAG